MSTDRGPTRGAGLARLCSRARRAVGTPALIVLAALWPLGAALTPAPLAAQLPPDASWHTLESAHLRVTYPAADPRMEPLARHAVARGEVAWALLREAVGRAPPGRVDIVLTDAVDVSNATATPVPSNRIVLYARPPADDPALGYNADWIELGVVHELAHIFHLDRTGPLGQVVRTIFGRVPWTWPVFPGAASPRWVTEGLAVVVESDATGFGRLHGSWHEMVVRTAVLEGGLPPLDRVSFPWSVWPAGERPYIYGSLFLEFMRSRWGVGVIPALVERTADSALPPELALNRIAQGAAGVSFSRAWRLWGEDLLVRYGALRDSLEARGLTRGQPLTGHGRWALFPRHSPDGTALAYTADDGRSTPVTRLLDPATGAELAAERRHGQAAVAWLPDGGLLTSQLEYADPYRVYSDLWRVDPGRGQSRLTRHERLQDPDVAPDGRLVAVRNGGGTTRLEIGTPGMLRPLTAADPSVHWAHPRWSPDGGRVAAVRWRTGGSHELVVLTAAGEETLVVEGEGALLRTPAWSPDGAWLLFTSDRTGITNVYVVPAATGAPLRQVTEVLGGAYHPDVAPDGQWLVFADYRADGFHLVRMPFAPAAWRTPGAPITRHRHFPDEPGARSVAAPVGAPPIDTTAGVPRPYRAIRHARPHFWSPVLLDGGRAGTFLGAGSAGTDLVGRHRWSAWAAVSPGHGRWQGGVAWNWAGLGRPVLSLSAAREWDWLGRAVLPDSSARDVLLREDRVALLAVVPVPRWRRSLTVSAGPEMVRRRRVLVAAGGHALRYPRDHLLGAVLRAGYADYQVHPLGISRQDGVALGLAVRRRWDVERTGGTDRGYSEYLGTTEAYVALGRIGFADAVLAGRASGLLRRGGGARPGAVGGASSGVVVALGGLAQEGARLLPVRGFEEGDRAGTRAWTASTEVRVPVALVGRGVGLLPVFLDRVSVTVFTDAGAAACPERPPPVGCGPPGVLVSTGGELVLDAALGFRQPLRLRLGTAVPLRGPGTGPVFHVGLGASLDRKSVV